MGQGPMDRMGIIELKECWRKFLHHNNIIGCWISIQGPMDRVSIIQLKECWRKFLHHNNIKGCWILNPRSDGSSVHHRAQIMLEEVFTPQQYQRMLDFKSKVRWIECPSCSSNNVGGGFYTTTISKDVGF